MCNVACGIIRFLTENKCKPQPASHVHENTPIITIPINFFTAPSSRVLYMDAYANFDL